MIPLLYTTLVAAAPEQVREDERSGAHWSVRGVLGLARTMACER